MRFAMYVPLRVHGWHSLMTGVDAPANLLERAGELELPALALTDVDTTCGVTEFLKAAERREDAGGVVRPILGAELSEPPGESRAAGDEVAGPRTPSGRPGRLVALVRNETGYRNLQKLVSARRLGDDPGEAGGELPGPEAFDLVDAAVRFREGLFYLVDHPRLVFALAGRLAPDEVGVAISPACLELRGPRGRRRVASPGERAAALEDPKTPPPAAPVPALELVESARAVGFSTLAVPDVYWARPEGFEHHRVRTAIKHNALRCDLPDEWLAARPGHLLSPAEMRARYAGLPDVAGPFTRERGGTRESGGTPGALVRTLEVAELCRFVPPLGGVLFPEIELEPGETPYSRLCRLAFEGATRRYTPLRPEVVRRLDYELSAIEELGYAPYFLLVLKIADFARGEGIPHVGRGSAADSLVSYCLGLTDADPLRYELPFERFLNPARKDRPDIDLDFCWRRRDEVLGAVWEAFGAERTAMIATLNRFGLRAAFREAALAEGIPPVEVNRWSRRLPWLAGPGGTPYDGGESDSETDDFPATESFPGGPSPGRVGAGDGASRAGGEDGNGKRSDVGRTGTDPDSGARRPTVDGVTEARLRRLPSALAANPVARSFAATPECRDFPFDDPRYAFVLRIAAALLDAPRHLGLHPGGVVVAPGPITDVVACQRAAKGVVMTQLDKDGVEALGLVKMDLLGNRALTVIDDCRKLIEQGGGRAPDVAAIPEDDPETARLLVRGRTLGCFQVESPGMRNLLQQIGAGNMTDVIQAVALIRPGPAGSGMKDAFVRRFRGREEPHPPHPRLTQLLWGTHGVMLYQEDVMQAVVLMAGFELSTADELRRALAKRRGPVLDELQERYFEGCAREGIRREEAEHVWELVLNFASFGFCKAHAVTYGRIAYRTVYLKTHYPAAYLAAFLNSQTGYYETRVYVEEARRLGVPILPPDVNRSREEFSLELTGAGPALRVGLDRVKGLTRKTLETLVDERGRGGPFLSLPDFLARAGARVDETEKLIQSGAFDAFDRTRPEMLWRLALCTAPHRRPPRDLAREAPLDPAVLAACRKGPDERARESATGIDVASGSGRRSEGWSGPRIGVGDRELSRRESASLFPEPRTPALALPPLPETDAKTRGRLELELLGLTVDSHPTELFPCAGDERRRARGARDETVPCGRLADLPANRSVALRGWLAASRRVRTDDGRWMRFLTLEDTSGLAEVVLFPDVYERCGHRLTNRGPFLISGRIEDQLGAVTLHAERIW